MICQAAEERTVTMFFTCIFPLSAVQPVCLIQLSGKTAGNFLFLLSGSSSSCFENLLTLHLRSAASMHFFKIMTSTRKTPKIKVRDCPCFIPSWHATQWTLSKLMMTHNLLVSKTAETLGGSDYHPQGGFSVKNVWIPIHRQKRGLRYSVQTLLYSHAI